jgi:uncharacterized protein
MSRRPRKITRLRRLTALTAVSIAGLGACGAPSALAFMAPTAAPVAPVSSPAAAPPELLAPPATVPSTLSITGEGAVEIAPDVATVSIEVRSSAATAAGARSKANARTNAVLAAITKLGIDRGSIQTSGISLTRSQVAATRHHPAHKLYAASNDLTVRTTEVSLVGPIVDGATQAGADSIDGPDFSFGDPSAGKAAATRAALADARSRADDAAAAIGYKIVGVQSVAIDPDESLAPVSAGAVAPQAAEVKAPTPTPVEPGQQEVDASVDVVFTIAPVAG